MERKIGEIFTYKGKTYQVIETNACKDCAFKVRLCEALESITGTCIPGERTDHTSVSFKLINNMEIKNNQLTIDIPEGMEIDLENSNLAKGIVKFKKKDITYENVEDALKLGKNCKSIIINESNASKLVTLSKLMNIAKYYNKDWKPDWNNSDKSKYYIRYNTGTYAVDCNYTYNYGNIFFKNKEDAQAVIENPNFRNILDKIYKN
mgnify:CR=1 FL=1